MLVVICLSVLCWKTLIAQESHFEGCPDTWTQYGGSCYHGNSSGVTVQVAIDNCRLHQAHLVSIQDDSQNEFVRGSMDAGMPSVWLGARYDRSKQKWFWFWDSDTEEENQTDVRFNSMWSQGLAPPAVNQSCSAVKKDGWWVFADCAETRPFVCQKPRSCVAGWFKADCSARCHCRGSDPCSRQDGVCPRGCSPGWTGPSCTLENPLPEASFHCLKTSAADLSVELTVDVKGRHYSVIQAVSEQGTPLACALPKIAQRSHQVFVTLLLKEAFADLNDTGGLDNNGTEAENTSVATATSLSKVTQVSHPHTTTLKVSGVTKSGHTVTRSATAAPVTVATSREEKKVTEAVKRDVSSSNHDNSSSGKECVASQGENGSVTWLIQFKEFPDVITGNDVTVEVTCDLDEVDSMEFMDSILDNSERGDPLEAALMRVVTSVYLSDSGTGQPAEHFHLGQRLQLHVDLQGLADYECGFPHSCVARPKGHSQGKEVLILDEHGCGRDNSPVKSLNAYYEKGRFKFVSNIFPAFSLGTDAIELECQVDVQIISDPRDCLTSCRKP